MGRARSGDPMGEREGNANTPGERSKAGGGRGRWMERDRDEARDVWWCSRWPPDVA
eukprot:ctg_3374.g593